MPKKSNTKNIWRDLKDLNLKDREIMWKNFYLLLYPEINNGELRNKIYSEIGKKIKLAIESLNDNNKTKNLTPNFLKLRDINSSIEDFKNIFLYWDETSFYESLICFITVLEYFRLKNNWSYWNSYSNDIVSWINDILLQFWLNYEIINNKFVTRQWKYISEKIYNPVLEKLSDETFHIADKRFKQTLEFYRKWDYNACITCVATSLEAVLQIKLNKKIWEWTFWALVEEAINKNYIDKDPLSLCIVDPLKKWIARWRKDESLSHPNFSDWNEKNAKLFLNLWAVFLQYIL